MRSGLAACGVTDPVAERCIAHQPTGIVGIYNRHKYEREIAEAFMAWERRLLTITSDNVVRLPTPAAVR